MSSESGQQLRRRELLATIGMSAVAGCGSGRNPDSPTRARSVSANSDANQQDCVARSDYEQLRNQYEDLRNQYNDLREQYIDLQNRVQNAKFPPYIVSDRRFVSVTYETMTGDIESWQWDSSTLSAQFTSGFFIREMTYSQLEYVGWNEFGFEGSSKYTQLGDFGYYYQLNPFVVPSNFQLMSQGFHDRHRSDIERIRAAWNFTTQVNDYVSEIEETPRFPLETLLMGGGDCEDSAILLGSIIYSMPTDYDVKFWYMDADNPTDPQTINHVVLSVETEEGPIIIETTSDTMRPWDEINGFSVTVEPTQTFDQ